MLALPPPPQPAHIKTSIVVPARTSHVGRLTRPAIITNRARMKRVNRSRPSWGKLKWKRKETGSAGTAGASVTAVVATLIVAVADVLAKRNEAGIAMHFAPVGAPEHVSVIVPLKPPWGVRTSE